MPQVCSNNLTASLHIFFQASAEDVKNSFTDNEAPVSIVYDATTDDGNAAFVGFISGLAATRWTHKTVSSQTVSLQNSMATTNNKVK